MTIKHLGGVFGRNPTFEDVTIEGTLTFDGAVDITTDLTIDGTLTADGLAINDGTSLLARTSSGAEIDVLEVRNNATATSTASTIKFVNSTAVGSNSGSTELVAVRTGTNTGDFKIRTSNSSASMVDRLLVGSDGDISVSAGNLVIATSGKGIDFSATSGTGTSELFDDYEEGTWTPVVEGATSAGTGTYGNQVGIYTKVGRVVQFQCWLQVSSHTGTGACLIKGLPFTASSNVARGTGNLNYFANLTLSASHTASLQVVGGQAYLVLNEHPVGGGVTANVNVDPNMQIRFSGSYTV